MKSQVLWKCLRGVYGTKRLGCGFWNVYQSKKDMPKRILKPYRGVKHDSKTSSYSRACKGSGFGRYRPRLVDTRCRHCNARVRFQLAKDRGDGRGRKRRVIVLDGLDEWTLQELLDECNRRNRGEQLERDEIGFVRAKNYRRR